MVRHFTGHVSTHELHTLQRRRLICHVFSFGSTQIAWLGHFFWHILHEMHLLTSITTCPRDRGVILAVFTGYIRVAGFRKTLLATVPTISKNPILVHLSAHPIHGSIEWTITGTSASSQPFSIATSGGIFVKVGVLTRDLARFFVPLPFT
jgi:hypothetical protein